MSGMNVSVTTLADIKREGWILTAQCCGRDCGAGRRLDVDAMIARFGPDHVVINDRVIPRRLRCLGCGHLGGRIYISVSTSKRK